MPGDGFGTRASAPYQEGVGKEPVAEAGPGPNEDCRHSAHHLYSAAGSGLVTLLARLD